MAQFWVRNAASHGECYLGGKELKEKAVQVGKNSASNVSFQGQQLSKDGATWLAEHSTDTKWPCRVPRCLCLGTRAPRSQVPQVLTKPNFLLLVLIALWFRIPSILLLHFFHPRTQLPSSMWMEASLSPFLG